MAEEEKETSDASVEEPVQADPGTEDTEQVEDAAPADAAPDDELSDAEGDGDALSKLRREAAGHRVRAKEAETRVSELQQQVFSLLVAADGRLADPSDLPYSEGVTDAEGVAALIDALITAKPHFAAKVPAALPEQSVDAPEAPAGPSFGELLRNI